MTSSHRRPGSPGATTFGSTVGSLIGSAAGSWALMRLLHRVPPALGEPWARTNHAGRGVTLLEGPAWVGGVVAGAAVRRLATRAAHGTAEPSDRHGPFTSNRFPVSSSGAATVVALASGALGALDDLTGGAADKGLKGHLGALSRGEVTTGVVKIVGLAATGLVGAALVDAAGPVRRGLLATLLGGGVVAGAANAVNLFDLRPGRALKVTVLAGLPLLGTTPGSAAVGSSLGVVGDDLAARSMLGDTGANAAGALVGLALVERTGLLGRAAALTGLAALTLASERVSFTRLIEGNRLLRRLDEWGRVAR